VCARMYACLKYQAAEDKNIPGDVDDGGLCSHVCTMYMCIYVMHACVMSASVYSCVFMMHACSVYPCIHVHKRDSECVSAEIRMYLLSRL
jgi:hypothetical protein